MEYLVSDLERDIRIALDKNMSSATLTALEDVDTLSVNDIIESKIADAARLVESDANYMLLDQGEPFGDSIGWESAVGYGSGHMQLPDDFLRLVTFQMSDWDYAVNDPIDETNPLYAMQHSRYAGIRGCPQKPVVAITQRPVGLVLEFYSCVSGENAYIKRAQYIPIPKIKDGKISICEKLRPAVVYYAAYLAAMTLGAADAATALLPISKALMGVSDDES